MNLLFAIDDNFVQQLETVLLSIHLNTKSQEFNIYVLQKNRLTKEAELAAFCKRQIAINKLNTSSKHFSHKDFNG
ncbi:hypothetical protein [Limosilactobacillus vaginalis]|uniref:hypothetical protein n=1 Tax=Limosilactobacillus vaginalis TaxID=1633 RepID=UPI0025A48660|nr:hypothetical protein [Limosilactobacillus vaginalis]MDM8264183.1 hypothetical protein [Limosilactobacillus vaginalis]